MSTAIMQTGPIYDFDIIFKSQPARTAMNLNPTSSNHNNINNSTTLNSGLIGSTPAIPALYNNNNNNNNNNNTTANNNTSNTNNNNTNNNKSVTTTSNVTGTTSPTNSALYQQINATVIAAQQLQHQQQAQAAAAAAGQQLQHHNLLLHNALTRAVSHPVDGRNVVNMLTNSIDELMVHRKLERTQSEPLPQVNTSRYKTELCRPFEEAGECKYGDKCQFAHGEHELRNLQRHPKYKTEMCRTFHSVGFCPYGPRCHFVHNVEEARKHNRKVDAYNAHLADMQMQAQQAAQYQGQAQVPCMMTPPSSNTSGSDRASPTESLSISPNYYAEQNSPMSSSSYRPNFLFTSQQTPPDSPPISPANIEIINGLDEARLPVFNQLSSHLDSFTDLAI